MKVALASDIHLEFGPISLTNDQSAEVLILSGDIIVANDLLERDAFEFDGNKRSTLFHTFFQECSARFPHVIYIAGNHEHYHGDYATTLETLKTRLSYLKNVHVLDREFIEIGDTLFFGGTLWTDMNKEDPVTLSHIRNVMNDFRIIDDSSTSVTYRAYKLKDKPVGMADEEWIKIPVDDKYVTEFKTRAGILTPETVVNDHKSFLQYLKESIESRPEKKWVVCGHHSPCKKSTKPRYEKDVIVNGAYSSDLSEFILNHPQIIMWTHGHTHDAYDYHVGNTRIVCNPRGYINYEPLAYEFKLKYFDV